MIWVILSGLAGYLLITLGTALMANALFDGLRVAFLSGVHWPNVKDYESELRLNAAIIALAVSMIIGGLHLMGVI